MLKRHSQIFEGMFTASDLLVVSCAWTLSYWIRFVSGYIPVDKGIPPFIDYVRMLIFVWLVWAFVFRRFNLYRPMRGVGRWHEIWLLVRANAFSVLLLLAATYLFREKSVPFSRLVFVIFWGLATVSTIVSRSLIRAFLRAMRRRGFNMRYALIVGSGKLAERLSARMSVHPEYGIELVGCLAGDPSQLSARAHTPLSAKKAGRDGTALRALSLSPEEAMRGEADSHLRILGTYADLPGFLESGQIDQVIIAMPLCDHDKLEAVIHSIGDSMVDVRIVPDVHQFIQLGSQVEEFDGLPVVSLASTPLSGINRVTKRVLDLILGVVILIFALPLMGVIALLIRAFSRGPILFTQERVGLDGETFKIYKFRTMYVDAERRGAQFAVRDDPRVTPIGRVLRRLSLDELPQLFNVIRGQMSLVGPRPERPVFINEFRRHVPKYMLRHKVQAGMTGWAQVNGWRGNTSIERRIEHDLYYIEHWSVLLDLKILFLTLTRGIRDRNAY